MRDLTAAKNVIEIRDAVSGDVHEYYYRQPTSGERIRYASEMVVRKGDQVLNRIVATRIKFGELILTGFKKGTLCAGGVLFASEPGDPDFRKDWLDLVHIGAPDHLALVAQTAFEGASRAGGQPEFAEADEDEATVIEEDDRPLASK